jgi:hypothetical protein
VAGRGIELVTGNAVGAKYLATKQKNSPAPSGAASSDRWTEAGPKAATGVNPNSVFTSFFLARLKRIFLYSLRSLVAGI